MVEPPGFRAFVEARSAALVRSAWLLTGDESAAEDPVQSALVRVWPRWSRIVDDAPEAYLRKVMLSLFLSGRRRRWHGELPVADLPEVSDGRDGDSYRGVDLQQALLAGLRALPPGQRAVLVLRYFEDASETQTAALLGCSVGTVKSQAARALERLRRDPALTGLLEVRDV